MLAHLQVNSDLSLGLRKTTRLLGHKLQPVLRMWAGGHQDVGRCASGDEKAVRAWIWRKVGIVNVRDAWLAGM